MPIHKYLFRIGILKTSHRILLSFPGQTGCDVQCSSSALLFYRTTVLLPNEPSSELHRPLCATSIAQVRLLLVKRTSRW